MNFPNRYLVFTVIIVIACICASISHLYQPSEVPDPLTEYTFEEFTAAKAALVSFDGPFDETSIDALIEWLGHGDYETRETVLRKLAAISASDERKRDLINSMLVDRLSDRCLESPPYYSVDQQEFAELQIASNILADQKDRMALGVIIECSTIQGEIAGWSSSHYATYGAVVKYGETAVPTLLAKYETARPELRQNIYNMIARIGGPDLVWNLKYLRRRETDPKIRTTLTRLIKSTISDTKWEARNGT